MPIRRFWFMQKAIGRVSAANDMRMLNVGIAQASDEEGINKYRDRLVLEIGQVSIVEEKLDREGLSRLAAM